MKSQAEIEKMLDDASEEIRNFSGMSYLDGVKAALEWALGQTEEGEGPLD